MPLSAADTSSRTKQCGMHNSPKNRSESFFCALSAGHKGRCAPHPESDRQGVIVPPALAETESQISALNHDLTTYEMCLGEPPTFPDSHVGDNERDCYMTFKLWELWKAGT